MTKALERLGISVDLCACVECEMQRAPPPLCRGEERIAGSDQKVRYSHLLFIFAYTQREKLLVWGGAGDRGGG
jgi:hypothetical protein